MLNGGQKKIIGSNNVNEALLPFSSKESYHCANSQITRGLTTTPPTLQNCFDRFPNIQQIAQDLNVGLDETFWTGPGKNPTGGYLYESGIKNGIDLLLENSSDECIEIASSEKFGENWLGCLWGSPEAPFSCICPDYNENFEAYLKLRQNVATFWFTDKDTPVKRQEFLDAIQYGPKVEITVPGDFTLKLGDVVSVNATGTTKNPQESSSSSINGKYWIVGTKHVVTNSGTHETRLLLSQLADG